MGIIRTISFNLEETLLWEEGIYCKGIYIPSKDTGQVWD
jgi:hypothetical protein